MSVLLALATASQAVAAVDETLLASRADGPAGAVSTVGADSPSISDDGCRVAFQSGDTSLTADVINPNPLIYDAEFHVYVRDVCLGTTVLVSRETGVAGQPQSKPDFFTGRPEISGDGTKVAWVSVDELDPVNDPGPDDPDVYVRDLIAGTTTLVSHGPSGTRVAGVDPSALDISEDGGFVTWTTTAEANTVDGTAAEAAPAADDDVFRWDRGTNTNVLVSRIDAVPTTGNGASRSPSISNDGSRVAFESNATDLVSGDSNGVRDIFVRSLSAGTMQLASRASGVAGAQANGASARPRMSADGKTVSFESAASNLGARGGTTQDIFVRDLDVSDSVRTPFTTELINRISGAEGDPQRFGTTDHGDPSGTGRFVTFTAIDTGAAPLAEGTIQGWNVYLRDRANQTTFILSRATGGIGPADNAGGGTDARISADGQFGAFASFGDNLVPGDFNGLIDVLRREFGEPAEVQNGANFNLRLLAGGATINGAPFEHSTNVPVGTHVDVTGGRIELTSDNGLKESMRFFGGEFDVSQGLGEQLTTLQLPPKPKCKKRKKKRKGKGKKRARPSLAAPLSPRVSRSLFGSGKGRFRTRGYRGAATVRGTAWSTADSCAGTRFTVTEGVLAIDDFGKRAAADPVISAPGTYLAKRKKGKGKRKRKSKSRRKNRG